MGFHQLGQPIREGTISASDGSVWSYEIAITHDARLLWVLHAPDKTHRVSVTKPNVTVDEVVKALHSLVERKSTN